jgi:hypothetical protein
MSRHAIDSLEATIALGYNLVIVSEVEHRVDARFLPRRVFHPFEVDVGLGQTGSFAVVTTCNMVDLFTSDVAPSHTGYCIPLKAFGVFQTNFRKVVVKWL